MTMKSDAKIEEELTCQFKIDMSLTNLYPSFLKSKQFALLRALFDQSICFKKVERSYV